MARYFMGVTDEQIQRERDKILSTDRDAIRALAPLVKAVTDSGIICAIGGESKIEENTSRMYLRFSRYSRQSI